MNAQWIFTERAHGDRWSGLGLRSAGGISASEWFNIAGGAGFLLAPDGRWNEGGRWHLFYLAPGSTQPTPASHLLAPIDPVYRSSPVHWAEVEARCVDFVTDLLGGEVTQFNDIVDRHFAKLAEQKAAEDAEAEAAASETDVAVEGEPAGTEN